MIRNKEQILSCIQPTGELHIGNYFGAIQNWVRLQDEFSCFYGIVDYHAMTMPYRAMDLRENTLAMAKYLVACGVNPDNLFIQSLIPEHTELGWILGCATAYGELSRQTQFKDKSVQVNEQKNDSFISTGLFTYPVLQAADILIYHADLVPVGKDQEQHLELSRTVANRFNHLFEIDYFKEPQALFTDIPKVMSLASPENKMSKSLGEKHCIGLFENGESIRKKVRSAVTDTGNGQNGEMSVGVTNLLSILGATGKDELSLQFQEDYFNGKISYKDLKQTVSDALIEMNTPFIKRLEEINNAPETLYGQVYDSSKKIQGTARQTLDEVRDIVGLSSKYRMEGLKTRFSL